MLAQEYEWQKLLDEREWAEVCFARVYKNNFKHGTDGHNRLLLLAKLSYLLDEMETTGGKVEIVIKSEEN